MMVLRHGLKRVSKTPFGALLRKWECARRVHQRAAGAFRHAANAFCLRPRKCSQVAAHAICTWRAPKGAFWPTQNSSGWRHQRDVLDPPNDGHPAVSVPRRRPRNPRKTSGVRNPRPRPCFRVGSHDSGWANCMSQTVGTRRPSARPRSTFRQRRGLNEGSTMEEQATASTGSPPAAHHRCSAALRRPDHCAYRQPTHYNSPYWQNHHRSTTGKRMADEQPH
jgi:hypothetical protein